MRLFLTSSGISSTNLKDFIKLLGRDPKGLKVAFIPTATNGELGKRITKIALTALPSWFSKDLSMLKKLSMEIEFIELEDLNEKDIVSAFNPFDIIYVYGGNTFFLMHHVNKSGFKKHLNEILNNKVYVGVSAGSVIVGPDVSIASWPQGDSNGIGLADMSGLSLVPYSILPHWDGIKPKESETYAFEVEYLKDGEALVVNS